jgi:hypothetical protein
MIYEGNEFIEYHTNTYLWWTDKYEKTRTTYSGGIGGGGGTAVPASNGSVLNSSELSASNWHTTILANRVIPSIYKNEQLTGTVLSADFFKNVDSTKIWQNTGRAPGVGGVAELGPLFSTIEEPGLNGVVILVY